MPWLSGSMHANPCKQSALTLRAQARFIPFVQENNCAFCVYAACGFILSTLYTQCSLSNTLFFDKMCISMIELIKKPLLCQGLFLDLTVVASCVDRDVEWRIKISSESGSCNRLGRMLNGGTAPSFGLPRLQKEKCPRAQFSFYGAPFWGRICADKQGSKWFLDQKIEIISTVMYCGDQVHFLV